MGPPSPKPKAPKLKPKAKPKVAVVALFGSSCAAGKDGSCGNCTLCVVGAGNVALAIRSVWFADERQEFTIARIWLVDSGTLEHLACRASLPRQAALG